MGTNFFEVVVCGSDLTGTIAAALLARRGLRVLLVGHDQPPPTFEAAGYVLDREPNRLPPLDTPAVTRVFAELNQTPIVRRRGPVTLPGLRLTLSDVQMDLHPPDERENEDGWPLAGRTYLRELFERTRKISATLDPLLGADLTLPPDGFWERREVGRTEDRLAHAEIDVPLSPDHPFRAGLVALSSFGTSLAPGELGAVAQARALDVARRGMARFDGGMPALSALFHERLETYSATMRLGVEPVELVLKRNRVIGLRVGPRDEMIGLGHLVWAGSTSELLALAKDKASRRLRETAASIRPVCYRYTLAMLVRPDGIPRDLGPRTIAIHDPGAPPWEDNALDITVGTASARQPEQVPIWIECLIPAAAAHTGTGYLALVRARVRQRLSQLFPSLERHAWVVASPHDNLAPEVPDGSPGPKPASPVNQSAMRPGFASDQPRMMGLAASPHATGIRNLVLANRENLPGLGFEGDFVSAWGCARLIAPPRARRRVAGREILFEEA